MTEDLSPLKAKPFTDAVDKLEELMTQNGRAFLLGAGCSKCAGLPLTAELTLEVLRSHNLDESSKEILTAIQTNFAGASFQNIEDYLSELVDLLAIADRRNTRSASKNEIDLGGKQYSAEALRNATEQIKRAIAEVIDKDVCIKTHWEFVKSVHRPVRPGKAVGNQRVDYLVLNYDTLIEDALALEKVRFADGLDGGSTGWWNLGTFSDENLSARVLKLHGSINWCQFPNETMPRRVPKSIKVSAASDQRIVIWPASTKYRETQLDPYAQLATLAREVLRPKGSSQRVLLVCGYKFGDSHINLELDRALRESRNLTLVVFWSNETIDGILKQWHEDASVREQILIYGKRGFWHGDTINEASADLPWWKFENVTRLLGGER
ncbi:SIR2 family protein [Myxococcota bacterium]|nr:SIR2 family protein [Myxococcota bacterium]